MDGIDSLYGFDMVPVMFGEAATRAPMFMYVQDADRNGLVTFVGSSQRRPGPNPLRYGSERTHQLIVGDVVVIPRAVIATDALVGHGLGGLLVSGPPSGQELLSAGEILYLAPGYRDDLTARRKDRS